ncbi:MAG: hypothetical protein O7J95_21475 [Planctomycetota bacterium]|nr:hypothetical protein [Planctomycetota bacterium]
MRRIHLVVVVCLGTVTVSTCGYLALTVRPAGDPGETLDERLEADVRELSTDDDKRRGAARRRLVEMAERHPSVLPALIARLERASGEERVALVAVLGRLGSAASAVLEEELFHDDANVSVAALVALGQLATESTWKLAAGALSDRRQGVRFAAVDVLARGGEKARGAAPALASALKLEHRQLSRGDAGFRKRLGEALVAVGEASTPHVLRLLREEDTSVSLECLDILGRLGPAAGSAVPYLAALVGSSAAPPEDPSEVAAGDAEVVRGACRVLARCGVAGTEKLAELLSHPLGAVRETCLRELEGSEEFAGSILEALQGVLLRGTSRERELAARVLARLGPEAAPLAEPLFELLTSSDAAADLVAIWSQDPDAQVPWSSSGAVSRTLPRAVSRRPPRAVNRPSSRSRKGLTSFRRASPRRPVTPSGPPEYFRCIARMGPGAVPFLARRLAASGFPSDVPELARRQRYVALALLEALGEEAAPARPVVVDLLDDEDPAVRVRAVHILPRCGEAEDAARRLVDVFRREVREVPPRRRFIDGSPESGAYWRTLTALRGVGAGAVRPLLEALEDDDWRLRHLAVRALTSEGVFLAPGREEEVVGALVVALEDGRNRLEFADPDPAERRGGARAFPETCILSAVLVVLKDVKSAAAPAVPVVLGLLGDEALRPAALETLAALGVAGGDAVEPIVERLLEEAREEARDAVPDDLRDTLVALGRPSIVALAARLSSEEPEIRYRALWTLAAVATGESVLRERPKGWSRPVPTPSRRGSRTGTRSPATRSTRPTRTTSRRASSRPLPRSGTRTSRAEALKSLRKELKKLPAAVEKRIRRELGAPSRSVRTPPGRVRRTGRSTRPAVRRSIAPVLSQLLLLMNDTLPDTRAFLFRLLRETDLWLDAVPEKRVAEVRRRARRGLEDPVGSVRLEAAGTLIALDGVSGEEAPLAELLESEILSLETECRLRVSPDAEKISWHDREPREERRETTLFWLLVSSLSDGGPAVVPHAVRLLRLRDSEAAQLAGLHLIRNLRPRPASRAVTRELAPLVEDGSSAVLFLAAATLQTYGENAAPALGALASRIESDGSEKAGESADPLPEVLVEDLFGTLETARHAAIPHLPRLLSNDSSSVRRRALQALIAVGAPVERVDSSLRRLTRDPEPAIREYASWALRRLGRRAPRDGNAR